MSRCRAGNASFRDGVVYGCTLEDGHSGAHVDERAQEKRDATWSTGNVPGGRVVSRHECDTCSSDHFGIKCVACGWFAFDYYYLGGEPFTCRCGADVTPTADQVARWERYEFDEDDDDEEAT